MKWSETEDAKEWDNFVSNNGGSIFHTWAWRSVLEGADVNPTYLVCREGNGTIRAVCPFFQTTGKRLRYLDSLPDSFMGGPIPKREESNPSEIIQSLVQSVRFNPFNTIAKVQIRAHRQEIVDSMIGLGFPYNTLYGLFIADLITRPPEHVWNNGFLKHDRQAVKYYGVAGSVFRLAESESDFAEYLGMKEGPTFHLYNQPNFFSKMRLSLGDNLKVGLVYFEEKVIAGVVLLSDPATSTVHLATMRYSTVKNIHSPVIYANWKVINWASEQGLRYVDFGLWLAEHVLEPGHFAHKMKSRFELNFLPSYVFSRRPSGLAYAMATRVNRLVLRVRGNIKDKKDPSKDTV